MPLTLSAAVQAEIGKKFMTFVEQWQFEFDTSTLYKWALLNIPAATAYDGLEYEARIWRDSAKTLPRGGGKKSRSVTVRVRNDDNLLTAYIDAGGSLEMGRVKMVRLFPDLVADPADKVVGTWANPYWFGFVKSAKVNRMFAELKVEYGLPELSRPFGRNFETTCTHTYDDAFLCPVSILAGRGLPQPTGGVGAATAADAGSMTSDIDLVAAGVIVGHLVVMMHASDNTKKSTATVTATNVGGNPNKISIDSWGLSGTPAATWKHVIGAKYTDCDYTQHACILRGMKGPTTTKAALLLNKSQRDYFGGLTDPSQQKIPVRHRVGAFNYQRYDTTIQANHGKVGQPIPIPIGGPHRVRIKPAAWFDAGDFLHVIVPIGEARIGRIQAISIDGFPPDNDTIGEHPVGNRDSLVYFGFEHYLASGATPTNDSDAVAGDGLTARQVKEGIGIRNGFGASNQAKVDTYLDGLWQFRDDNGNGYSLANCSHLVLRIQKDRVEINSLEVELTIGEGVQLLKTDLSTWIGSVDMAELAMNACINQRWGGGMDSTQLLTQDFIDASVICRTLVTNTQTEIGAIADNVDDGPDDNEDDGSDGDKEDDGGTLIIPNAQVPPGQLVGGKLSVTVGGVPQERTITYARAIPARPKVDPDPQVGKKGGPFVTADARVGDSAVLLKTDSAWSTGKVPSNGDSFTIAGYPSRARYMANGILNNKAQKLEEALDEIALNCNGGWYYHQAKVGFAIRAQETLAVIDARMTITDKGATPNVIRRRGVGGETDDLGNLVSEEVHKRVKSVSSGNDLLLDEVVESSIEISPSGSQRTAASDAFRQTQIKSGESRSQDSAIGFQEKDSNTTAVGGEPVPAFSWDLKNKPLSFESTQIVGGLAAGVGRVE